MFRLALLIAFLCSAVKAGHQLNSVRNSCSVCGCYDQLQPSHVPVQGSTGSAKLESTEFNAYEPHDKAALSK